MKSRAALAIEIFTKKNVARQDLGNRVTAVSPGSREEVPKQQRGKKLKSPTSCTAHGEGRMNYLIVTYPPPSPSLWYQYLGHSYSHERLAGQPRGKTDLINILLIVWSVRSENYENRNKTRKSTKIGTNVV